MKADLFRIIREEELELKADLIRVFREEVGSSFLFPAEFTMFRHLVEKCFGR